MRRPALGRRATARLLTVAAGLAALCWYLGADVWHSILVGGVLTIVGVIGSDDVASPESGFIEWREGDRRGRSGARSDVAEVAQSLRGPRGRVSGAAAWRVAQIARRRLSPWGLDLDDPTDRDRIEQLIGRGTYVVLTRGQRRPPRRRALLRCLDALDALDPARAR